MKSPPYTERKSRILRAAERLFLHYGPAKTTIADIARACDIGVGSVYLDFDSKEAILQELSSEKSKAVANRMRAAAAKAGPAAADKLVSVLQARVGALLDMAQDGQHACDLVRCSTARWESEPGFGFAPRAVVAEILEKGMGAHEIAGESVAGTLDALELAFSCLSPPSLYRMERSVAETRAARLSAMIVRGLTLSTGSDRPPPERGRP